VKLRHFYSRLTNQIKALPLPPYADAIVAIALTSLTTTGLTFAIQQIGKVEPFELFVYDRLMQLRGDAPLDPRILIVGIGEDDIFEQNIVIPPDQTIAEAISILQESNPQIIGLDLHRNTPNPPGWSLLLEELQADNIVVIKKLGGKDSTTIEPPEGVPPERVGFNNFPVDPDGVVRRNLMLASDQDGRYFSFSLLLAIEYLKTLDVVPKGSIKNPDLLQLGEAVFVPLRPGNGGYHQVDARGYQILFNYRGNQAIRQVSLSDVLNDRVDASQVEGQIVLIGSTAESLKDLFFTPYSTGESTSHKMSGVEIHAQMVSQFLDAAVGDRPLFWFWPQWGELAWLWLWAVLGSIFAWIIRKPLVMGISFLGLLIVLSGSAYGLFLLQGWIPIVAPALALGLSMGFIVTYQSQQAQLQSLQAKQQQEMVMKLLGQSTSPEVANALWEERDRLLKSGKLPGQKLTATMLFSDIRGFSTLAERLPPEEVLDWLNEYLNEMVEAVMDYHGIVNKFTGDGLMAVFGVPVPRTAPEEIAEDAQHAVTCALEMSDRLELLNRDWSDRGFATAKMRIGIFTGPVVAGSLGGRERLEYGVIGDSVNTAARLEGCVKTRQPGACRILIARETLEYLDDQFIVEPWGEIELKGKEQLAEVYRVIRRRQETHSKAPFGAELPGKLSATPVSNLDATSLFDSSRVEKLPNPIGLDELM